MVAGRSQRLTGRSTVTCAEVTTREADHKRHANLRSVEALAVIEEPMLSQALPVIGRDDHQCVVENAPPLQLVEKLAELLSRYAQAIVIGIPRERASRAGTMSVYPPETSLPARTEIHFRFRNSAEAVGFAGRHTKAHGRRRN